MADGKLFRLCVTLAVILGAPVWAQNGRAAADADSVTPRTQARWTQLLAQFDTDRDGRLVFEEFAVTQAAFAQCDADKDGAITPKELSTIEQPKLREQALARFDRLDEDGDGRVTLARSLRQLRSGPRAGVFARLDANGDGSVTAAEYVIDGKRQRATDRELRWSKLLEWHDRDGDGRLTTDELASRRPAGDSRPFKAMVFRSYDSNGDGRVGRQEFLAGRALRPRAERDEREKIWNTWVGRMDADGDGQLDREEFGRGREVPKASKSDPQSVAVGRFDKDGDGVVTRAEFFPRKTAAAKPARQ